MADPTAIISCVSWGSKLALELYKFAATTTWASYDINKIARTVSNLSFTVKQIGATIKEDDRYPSLEAEETIESILEQCKAVYNEIEDLFPIKNVRDGSDDAAFDAGHYGSWRPSPETIARLDYLTAHLDALKSTVSVMLQTLYTVQIVLWARTRPTISPQKAVKNERIQMETLVIEQQLALWTAFRIYEENRERDDRPDPKLLMEKDSSRSLATRVENDGTVNSSDLARFQDTSLTKLHSSDAEAEWISAICDVSKSRVDFLLNRWTRLKQLQEQISDGEHRVEAKKRERLQPTVESDDSGDEIASLPRFRSRSPRSSNPDPRRPPSVQPLFTENPTLPIPVPDTKYGPTAPLSPASSYGVSPRSSGNSLSLLGHLGTSPQSPHTSVSSIPVKAAEAVSIKEDDEGANMEIPWRLCSKSLYWEYIDGKFKQANNESPSSHAFTDKHSWTEIMASWVCKEAIEEAGYKVHQVQKERREGRRTKFETCFQIQRPLTFAEVHRLVERTVEIFRQNQPSSLPPRRRRSSAEKPPSLRSVHSFQDRDRTPLANQHPPLNRSTTAYPFPPPPLPLDRSVSMPSAVPTYPPLPYQNPNASSTHLPILPGPYPPQSPPFNPQQGPFTPQSGPYSPQTLYPPGGPFSPGFSPTDQRRFSSNGTVPHSPLRNSYSSTSSSRHDPAAYSSTSTTSDSDGAARSRRRKSSNGRRQPSTHSTTSSGSKKKHHSTVGTLAKVGGLAALLDGIVDLGVL